MSFGAGRGQYAHVNRDCSSNITGVDAIGFSDAAVSIEHTTPTIKIGVNGGVASTGNSSKSWVYINPKIGK
ncbi:MAG: hypothetical protein V1799_09650 [bacterium]